MSYHRPVGDDPFKYKVEPIQEHKHEKPPGQELPPPQKKPHLVVFLLSAFRKFLDLFEEKKPIASQIKDHLAHIQSIFEILKTENRSQDAPFLNELSQAWHDLLDDSLGLSKTTAWNLQFWAFVKEIQHFPENQEHTLGYYLTEYVGQAWLPFPYMELVFQIHLLYQTEGELSPLGRWTTLIQNIQETFQP